MAKPTGSPIQDENAGNSGDGRSSPSIRFGSRRIPLPASRILRIGAGFGLIVAGVFGFLPVLGFWMVPAGLLVLSIDFALMRRWRRRGEVAIANNVLGRSRRKKPDK